MTDIETLVAIERNALLGVLERLDDAQWGTPSLCRGWNVRDLVVHLLMPYELRVASLLTGLATARFRFDAMADRWARGDTRTPEQVLGALRATAGARFRVPGAPPESPLSHLVIHLQDVYRPLGVPASPDPRSAAIVLDQMTGPRFRRSLTPGLLDGLQLTATDTGWVHGSGARVEGSASALITTLAGRSAALPELTGDGVDRLHDRMAAAS